MSVEIPSRKLRDILNDEQIFLVIYNDGRKQVVLDSNGPKPNPDAYIMITLQAAKEMVAEMEATLETTLSAMDGGKVDYRIYQPPEVALH